MKIAATGFELSLFYLFFSPKSLISTPCLTESSKCNQTLIKCCILTNYTYPVQELAFYIRIKNEKKSKDLHENIKF